MRPGILFILLSVYEQFIKPEPTWEKDVHVTIEYLLHALQSCLYFCQTYSNTPAKSGNFPSRSGGSTDLVQWCHGAPAIVFLLSRAYNIWKEDKYLEGLVKAGKVIWTQGLLTKGASLCHGVGG